MWRVGHNFTIDCFFQSPGLFKPGKFIVPGALVAEYFCVLKDRYAFRLRFIVQILDCSILKAEIRDIILIFGVFNVKLLGSTVWTFQLFHLYPLKMFSELLRLAGFSNDKNSGGRLQG